MAVARALVVVFERDAYGGLTVEGVGRHARHDGVGAVTVLIEAAPMESGGKPRALHNLAELGRAVLLDGVVLEGAEGRVADFAVAVGSAVWASTGAAFDVLVDFGGDDEVAFGFFVVEGPLFFGAVDLAEVVNAGVAEGHFAGAWSATGDGVRDDEDEGADD